MGVFAGLWVLVSVVIGLLLAPTKIPAELLRPLELRGEAPPVTTGASPATPPPATQHASPEVPAGQPAAGAQTPKDLFGQLSSLPAAARTPQTASAQPAPTTSREDALEKALQKRLNLAGEWLASAWPVVLLCLLIAMATGLWLQGGRIGYLATVIGSGRASLSAFWTTGLRSFGALLGGWFLSITAFAGIVTVLALLGAVFSALFSAAPAGVRALFGMALSAGVLIGMAWLVVRLAFWFIAIVVDRVGPVAGLSASFRATRGRWGRVFGLGALLGLIALGVEIVLRGLAFLGGPTLVTILLVGVPGVVARLYVGFAAQAAFIHCYAETKSAGPAAGSGTP